MPRKKTLGFGFWDEVAKVSLKTKHFNEANFKSWEDNLIPNFDPQVRLDLEKSFWRITIFFCFLGITFFALFIRLFHLQITNGKMNANLADGNRIQVKLIHAPRGVIYDRNGKVLALNSPGFRLVDPATEQSSRPSGTKKAVLLSREDAIALEVKNDPRAANLEIDSLRKYPYGQSAAHVLGYVGEISQDQLKQAEFNSYHPGDRIGQSGIESYYEQILKGTDGGEIIEVDSKGEKLRTLRTVTPIPGQNIYLTLDMDLQKVAFDKLQDAVKKSGSCCGALVAEDPKTGQILALVSYPSYDNNVFINADEGAIDQVLNDTNSPVLNRSIGGVYPPGSTFKIVSAIAGLGSGKINPQTTFVDNGEINLGTFKFTNWYFTQYGKTEGEVNLIKAIQRSNDIYFYEVGIKLGETTLAEYAKKLKLGSKLGIDLGGEVTGLIPDNDWKIKTFDQVWYPGDTLHMAIGQGYVLTTPIQVLGFTSYIAGGSMYKPYLLLKVAKDDGSFSRESQPQMLISKVISQDQLEVIKNGLKLVPKDGGTAWPFFTFPIPTAGKTGTAEYGDPKERTHAWYTSFAPADDPKIALTVLVEGGGEGSSVSAPVAKEIYRWYFSPDKTNLIKDNYQEASSSGKTLGE